MHMKNVHRGFKKYKCDDYGKNFTQNIGLKGHITWKKDSIVMNVANIFIENPIWECIYKLFMKKAFNCFCDYCGKNFTKTFKLKKHMQIIHESHKTLNWNYKLQLFMKIKRFNCHLCGKIFARVCNLKFLIKIFMKLIHEFNCEYCDKNFIQALNL